MQATATPEDLARVVARVESLGLAAHVMPGAQSTCIGITGNDSPISPDRFAGLAGVGRLINVSQSFKMSSREFRSDLKGTDTRVQVGVSPSAGFGGGRFGVIAGPCSVESREQILETAVAVRDAGAHFLRGGAFKPRTSPYAFRGLKEEGLELLAEARDLTGLGIVTEVVDTETLDMVADYADILQLGARNMQNYSLLEAVGKTGKPVLLKRGMSATLMEFLNAAEYLAINRNGMDGQDDIILCERGIRTFETATRNTFDINAIPVLKRLTHLPVIADPSHGIGIASDVPAIACAALAAGADGMIVEVHVKPEEALSDGQQSLTPSAFSALMTRLRKIADALDVEL
jgi:3-deoxy-7-phosphoheptulonate synthase